MPIYEQDSLARAAFGELVTAESTPVVQIANQYQLDPALRSDLETFEATGGSADNTGNLFRCQSGTSVGGYGVVRSKEAVIYRAGDGVVEVGVTLTLQCIEAPSGNGLVLDTATRTATSDSNGKAEFTNLIRGAKYQVWRSSTIKKTFTASDAATFEIPSFIGSD